MTLVVELDFGIMSGSVVRFPLQLLCASGRMPHTALGSVYNYNLFFTGSDWETIPSLWYEESEVCTFAKCHFKYKA